MLSRSINEKVKTFEIISDLGRESSRSARCESGSAKIGKEFETENARLLYYAIFLFDTASADTDNKCD